MITANEAFKLLEEVVEGQPEKVYQKSDVRGCSYTTPEGDPSCIVGHVLRRVLSEDLWEDLRDKEWGDNNVFTSEQTFLSMEEDSPKYASRFTHTAVMMLNFAQARQDWGQPWGDVLKDTRDFLNGLPAE